MEEDIGESGSGSEGDASGRGMTGRAGVNFDSMPPSAKTGILDMHYNMGGNKFNPSTFPSFFGALRGNDFKRAGIESHRTGIGEARNKKVQEKFNDAYKER